jgi:cytochrome P450
VTQAVGFVPPFVAPAARPLRFPFNLLKLLGNNLELIPEEAYRKPVVVAPGPPRMAFVTGPDAVKTLLLDRPSEFPKGGVQVQILRPLFGDAMISAEGKDWRWQRGVAAPLFRHDELLRYGPAMTAAAERVVAEWRGTANGVVRPIHTDMMRAAFEVISNTMLAGGAPEVLRAIEKGHADYYAAVNWWVTYTLLGLPHWWPRPGGRGMRAHEKRLRQAVAGLVKVRRASATGDDLLARLSRASDPESGQAMADANLVDNIVAFLMAGYDTTAFALTFTLYLIARSPQWEARMLEEVMSVAGTGPVTAEHVAQLVTVQQVLNESLRLFPTAPVIVRDIEKDIELEGERIPAGTIGIIPIYAIHRHRALWDDPNRFDPDRFGPDKPKTSRFQFLPFGAGPRICIGASFATIEATIMLATFVRAARFALVDGADISPVGRMFLVPRDGLRLQVTLRDVY